MVCRGLVGVLALGACKPPALTVTYAYQVHAAEVAAHTEGPEPPAVETKQMLANARTVAFFPPDPCDAHCTQLVGNLEKAAEHAGYQVVSWQNLRGAKRPIDFAREANVDVLFQIDRIDSGTQIEAPGTRSLTFTADDAPVQVSPQLAQTCREFSTHAEPPHVVARTAAVEIEVLSVGDGVTRWRYQRTVAQPVSTPYTPISFAGKGTPSIGGQVLLVFGILAVVGGATLITFEQTSQQDPLNPTQGKFSTGGLSYALALAGLGGIIGGGYMMSQSPKPAPEDVLCDGRHMVAVSGSPPMLPGDAPSDEAIVGPLVDELQHAKGAK